jgi:hypothetical protein
MKNFLLGIFLACCLLVFVGLGFLFFYSSSQKEITTTQTSTATSDGVACQKNGMELRTFNAELVIPEVMKKAVSTGKKGMLLMSLDATTVSGKFETIASPPIPMEAPQGSQKLVFVSRCGSFSNSGNWLDGSVFLRLRYCYEENATRCEIGDKHIGYRGRFTSSIARLSSPEPIDLGRIIFAAHFAKKLPPECEPGSTTLSGQIIPTDDFLQIIPEGKKITLNVHDYQLPRSNPISSIEIYNSAKGMSFNFPRVSNVPNYVYLTARVCSDNESVKQCVEGNSRQIALYPKSFEYPTCGQKNVVFYLHEIPYSIRMSSRPRLAHERDKKLPQEIIEAAW